MAEKPIDISCTIQLPVSDQHVFIQLEEDRPERVGYQIDLRSPGGQVTNVVPKGDRQIPVLHDLGLSAKALRGYTMACVGVVGFAVAGKWHLKLESLVENKLVGTCGPGEIDASQGGASTFRFMCNFT